MVEDFWDFGYWIQSFLSFILAHYGIFWFCFAAIYPDGFLSSLVPVLFWQHCRHYILCRETPTNLGNLPDSLLSLPIHMALYLLFKECCLLLMIKQENEQVVKYLHLLFVYSVFMCCFAVCYRIIIGCIVRFISFERDQW